MKNKSYRLFFYYALVCLIGLFNLFPYRLAVRIGGLLGLVAFYLVPKERKKTIDNLRIAFGSEKTERELYLIARQVFENYGFIAAETNLVHKIIPHIDEWIKIDGRELIDEALKKRNGIAGVVAHFDNWEFLAGYLATIGYPVTVIARKIYYEKYNDLVMEVRRKLKVRTIYRDESPRKMLQVLRDNGILGFVADQDVDSVDGIFVDFFGHPAYTPVAPVRFAMASGAPLMLSFLIREGLRHRVVIEKPIELTMTGDKENDLKVNTQKWVNIQEKYIRQYPHLWVWNHNRWKSKPQPVVL